MSLMASVRQRHWIGMLTLGYALSGLATARAEEVPKADALLRDSDRARGEIADGLSWELDLTSLEDGTESRVTYVVKAKVGDALAEAIAPARHKGEMILFQGRSLWFFKPGLKKPMAISGRQRLMGQAANGDIASTNYSRDYEGSVVGQEKIGSTDCWRLDLKAKVKNVTYDAIHYWISKTERVGIRADFLTIGGDVFKSARLEYGNLIEFEGRKTMFISQMTITDSLRPSNRTVMIYRNPRHESLADSLFNVNNLVR